MRMTKLREQGKTGTEIFAGQIYNEDYNSVWSSNVARNDLIEEMMNDSIISACLTAMNLMLLQAEKDVVPVSQDNIDLKVADAVKDELFKNPSFSWTNFEETYLLSLPFGFYPFNKTVFRGDDNLFHCKLAPRKPKTITAWNQENESLKSINQQAYSGDGGYGEYTIENKNLLLFTNKREGNNYQGKSVLRPVYRPYYMKNNAIRANAIQDERTAIPVPLLGLPQNEKKGDKEKAENVGETFRNHQKSYVIKPFGWEFELLNTQGAISDKILKSIRSYNIEIVSSFMMGWILLGLEGSGSYNLGAITTGAFYKALQYYAKSCEDVINERNEGRAWIPEFVDYNFDVKEYPKFKYSLIEKVDIGKLSEALTKLATGGFLAPNETLESHLLKITGLPESPTIKTPKETKPIVKTENESDKETTESCECDHLNLIEGDEYKNLEFYRPMTKLEEKLGIATYRDELNKKKNELLKTTLSFKKNAIESLIDRARRLLAKNIKMDAFVQQLKEIKENVILKGRWIKQEAFTKEIVKTMKETWKYGRVTVQKELKSQGVKLIGSDFVIWEEGQNIIRPLAARMVNALAMKLVTAWEGELVTQKNLNLLDTVRVTNLLTSLSNRELNEKASQAVIGTFGQGRTFEAFKQQEKIEKIVRSEIMDSRICVNCKKIDNKEFSMDDPFYNEVAAGYYTQCLGGTRCRGINLYISE